MAEIIALPDKVIHIDDEDFEQLSGYQWRVIDNVAGRVGRRLPNGRYIGLAATLIGKRPGATKRLAFRDKDLRNFSRANLYWTDDCVYCGRPTLGRTGTCDHCRTEFTINQRCRNPWLARGPHFCRTTERMQD